MVLLFVYQEAAWSCPFPWYLIPSGLRHRPRLYYQVIFSPWYLLPSFNVHLMCQKGFFLMNTYIFGAYSSINLSYDGGALCAHYRAIDKYVKMPIQSHHSKKKINTVLNLITFSIVFTNKNMGHFQPPPSI